MQNIDVETQHAGFEDARLHRRIQSAEQITRLAEAKVHAAAPLVCSSAFSSDCCIYFLLHVIKYRLRFLMCF